MVQIDNWENTVFFRVDAEEDFMNPDGKLPVTENQDEADKVANSMERVTQVAEETGVTSVYTRDIHEKEDDEIAEGAPDYDETFPIHCERGEKGSEFIDAVVKEGYSSVSDHAKEFDFKDDYTAGQIREELECLEEDITIYKNRFNVFEGSGELQDDRTYADEIVDLLDPEQVVIDGVAADVCVDQAIEGLLEKEIDVILVEDATKGIEKQAEDLESDWNDKAEEYSAEFETTTAANLGGYAEAV